MRTRHFIKIFLLLAFPLSLCLTQASPGIAKPDSPAAVVLQLKWFHQFQFAGYYAAVEKGFYRDVDLDVTLREARPGLDITEELISGRADFLVNNPTALLARAAGRPIVALAAVFQHSPLVLLSRKDARILTPGDVIGKRTMLIPETESELVAMFIDEGVGLNLLDIMPHSWDVSDLISGKVDAMSGYLTDAPYLLEQAGVEYNLLRPLTYGIDFYGDVLFTTTMQIEKHPERVQAFRAASLRGWAYAMQHPDEMIELIIEKYGSRLSRDALRYEADAMRALILPQLIELGHMNPGRWQHIASTYIALGLLPTDFSLDGFLYRPEDSFFWNQNIYWGIIAVLVLGTLVVLILLLFNKRLRVEVQKSTRELRESRESLKQLADSMPQLVWSADSAGKIDYCNERQKEFRGFSKNPDGSWEWIPMLHPDDTEKTVKAWRTARENGSTFEMEHRVQRADGSYAWFLSRATPIYDSGGYIRRWFGTATDIDDVKKTQMALDEAKQGAEKANRIKSEFLAKMSHEIRTPITVIMSAIEHLLDTEKHPDRLKILDLADLSTKRLNILVEEILDFSKIEHKTMDLGREPFDVRRCLEDVVRMMQAKAKGKDLSLSLDISPQVPDQILGDEYRLGQIMLNLIGNAVKFTEKGLISVAVNCRDETLVFSVSDTGIGIPEDKLENIFDIFFQADSSITRRHSGAGLGLTISKGLIELMEGSIQVKSRPGEGSVFTFTLPLNV